MCDKQVQLLQTVYVMQSHITACLETSVFISYYNRHFFLRVPFFLSFFLSFFFLLNPMPSFLNVTVFHERVFTHTVYNQTSSWLLVG